MARIRERAQQRALVLRLKRVEGQLRGIQAMIEAGADCEKVAQQLSASRRALDKAFFNVLACGMEAAGRGLEAEKRLRHVAGLLARFG
jgi:DNA-binding FrmR family transcriptional regulator